jgi:hypothetical protein
VADASRHAACRICLGCLGKRHRIVLILQLCTVVARSGEEMESIAGGFLASRGDP